MSFPISFSRACSGLIFLGTFIGVAALTPSLAADQQEYEVVLHRPLKVGQHCHYEATYSEEEAQNIAVNDQEVRSGQSKLEGSIKGDLEVTGVSKAGELMEIKLTVREWSLTADGKPTKGLKAGDVVLGRAGKPSLYTLEGSPLPQPISQALSSYFSLHQADEPNTDEAVLAPGKKVKVGDAWPIHSEAAAADLSEKFGAKLGKDMVKGIVKLDSVSGEGAQRYLHLTSSLTVNAAGLKLAGLPEGVTTKRFAVSADSAGDLPVDPAKQQLNSDESLTLDVEASGELKQDGKSSVIQVLLSRKIVKKEKTDWGN